MLEPISIRAGGQGNCCDGGEVEGKGKGQSVMARGGVTCGPGSNWE